MESRLERHERERKESGNGEENINYEKDNYRHKRCRDESDSLKEEFLQINHASFWLIFFLIDEMDPSVSRLRT